MTLQGQGSPKGPSLPGPPVLPQHHQGLQTSLPLLTSELQTQPLASGPSAASPSPALCHSGFLISMALLGLQTITPVQNSDTIAVTSPHTALTAHPTGPPVDCPHPMVKGQGLDHLPVLVSPTLGH